MYKRPATSVGGSVVAAEFAFLHGRAFNLGGGLHHGLVNKANGFCYLNDLVFAIKRFRELGIRRIAYVDLDAHFCDCLLYTSPSPRDVSSSRMPSSA